MLRRCRAILPDGTRNAIHIQRLKDKLGNRSNASSEVEYHGAWARMVGEPGRGVPTIIEMVGHTRLDCVLGTAAGMRRGVAEATLARRPPQRLRQAAERPAADAQRARRPRARVRGDDGARDAPGARLRRRADDDPAEAHLQAPGTAVGKYYVCKRAPQHAFEALECFGGVGYVEESGMPRLYREAPLASIWEGSGNVMALDVLRALSRTPEALEAYFAEVELAAGADARFDAFVDDAAAPSSPNTDQVESRARRDRREDGAGAAGLAARAPRAAGRRRRVLRLAPGRRRRPGLRHAAGRASTSRRSSSGTRRRR